VGRPRSCNCGQCAKCVDRIRKKAAYDAMTPEQRRAWKRRKDPLKRYATDRSARRRHEVKYPEKAAARAALAKAIRSGKLPRQPCSVCGIVHGTARTDGTRVRVEGHHDDYTKALDVRWLCGDHHRPPWVPDRG
jgi:hypothetical protein